MKAHRPQRIGPATSPAATLQPPGLAQPGGNGLAQEQLGEPVEEEPGSFLLDDAFGAGGLGSEPPPELREGDEVGPERKFRAAGEGHRLFREVVDGHVVVMVASKVQSASEHLDEMQQIALRLPSESGRRDRALKLVQDARAIVGGGPAADGDLVDLFTQLFALVDGLSDTDFTRLEGPVPPDPVVETQDDEQEATSDDECGSVVVKKGAREAPKGLSMRGAHAFGEARLGENESKQYDQRYEAATTRESKAFADLRTARPEGADAEGARDVANGLLRTYSPATIAALKLYQIPEDQLGTYLDEDGWVEIRHLECDSPALFKRLLAGLDRSDAQALGAAVGSALPELLSADPQLTGGALWRLVGAVYGSPGQLATAIAKQGVPAVLDALIGAPGIKEVPGRALVTLRETTLWEAPPPDKGQGVALDEGILVHVAGEPKDGVRPVVVASFPERGRRGFVAVSDVTEEVAPMPNVDMDRQKLRGHGGGKLGRSAAKPFPHAPQPKDVAQGGLGDCFLLATLMSAAKTDPDRITAMIPDNSNADAWTVQLDGVQRMVRNAFPYDETAKEPTFAYTLPGRKLSDPDVPLWPAILEKAYATVRRSKDEEPSQPSPDDVPYEIDSYGQLFGGQPQEPMKEVLGLDAQKVMTKDLDAPGLVQQLRGSLDAKGSATAGTGGGQETQGTATLTRSAGRVYSGRVDVGADGDLKRESVVVRDAEVSKTLLADDKKGGLAAKDAHQGEKWTGSVRYSDGAIEARVDGLARPAPVTLEAEATVEGLVSTEPRVQSSHEYAVVGAEEAAITLIDPHEPAQPFTLTPAQVLQMYQWIGVGRPKK
jgi:hypothetical protein